jgi:hypothetical protein
VVGSLEQGSEGGRVAVQAADDIEGVGLQPGRLGERLRLVPVGRASARCGNVCFMGF